MTEPRPRVGIVAASLDIVGGQAVQARLLHERLDAEGWKVTFVPINPRFPLQLARLRGIPFARTMLNQGLYIPSLMQLRQCDVVHVFCASYWAFLLAAVPALLAARSLGKRVILNYHSGEAPDHLAHWGALVHPWLRLADEIVVPSEFLAQVFARHGHRARVIHNVVDLARFGYRERPSLRPVLLSNRNLEKHYRVDNTLRAFGLLQGRRGSDGEMTVAGQGSQESHLHALAETLGIEGVRFAGRVDPDAMPLLYERADVFVNSSVIDNQPLSILEAFAAGIPVVSTPTGGIAAMVRDGETGLIVAPDDPQAMASAVDDLLSRPVQARQMAQRARDELRLYTWANAREQWATVYRGAAA
jgi:glycosyltransferase involved in cell wall biosynthesis